jgi:sorting and assembly machinery component 37
MVLELHIWGPAFGLPSLDAQCLATVYYFQKSLPVDAWSLIPSSNPHVSPLGELPALKAGSTWIAGFSNIVTYLRDISNGGHDLDRHLNESQQADSSAFSSFLESRGQPLLDLSLYVSSDNYFASTRPALGDILLWPDSWFVPHLLRDKAKKRSEHLGLSSLDVDTAREDKSEDVGLTAHIPKSLRKPRQTVTSLLGRNMQKNRFRLDAATADFLDPLSDKLGDNKWLLGDSVSSVDCLAIGYLALLQVPQLPQAWVKEALKTKYAKLGQWASEQTSRVFGPSLDATMLVKQKKDEAIVGLKLPWQRPPERTSQQVLHSVLESCISSMPVIGNAYRASEIGNLHGNGDIQRKRQSELTIIQRRREIYVQVLVSTFTAVGLVGYLSYKGLLHLPRHVAKPRGRNFGEAGAFLGLV